MPQLRNCALLNVLEPRPDVHRVISMGENRLSFAGFRCGTSLSGQLDRLKERSVVIIAADQLSIAAALIELDGWAKRILICPPDLESRHFATVVRDAQADAIVCDGEGLPHLGRQDLTIVRVALPLQPSNVPPERCCQTEWVLLTSGTTGGPKMVVHTLATLMHGIPQRSAQQQRENWSTFYDIRRYGGLQIFLRACAGNGNLTLRGAQELIESFFRHAGQNGVTHISGTPAHWRLALMNAARDGIDPECVRLSGEIADDSLIQALSKLYVRARVTHAYASTEAGVVFEIDDGKAGFPATLFESCPGGVELKILNDALGVKSGGAALRYLGAGAADLVDEAGFVDTGDFIQQRGERYFFAGRRGGIINVGGAKVHPEEVENAINQHPAVYASVVSARKSPVTGSLVVANVLLKEGFAESAELKSEITSICTRDLAPYKVPALISFAKSFAITGAGKLARN